MKTAISDQLMTSDILANPYPYYKSMREGDPVHFDESVGAYLITRYDDIKNALRMTEELSNKLGFGEVHREDYQDEIDRIMEEKGYGPHNPSENFNTDPPLHTRMRSLVDQAFSAKRVEGLEGRISKIVDETLEKFIDRGEADFVYEFAIPIPMIVIAEQLGLSHVRLDDFKRWSDAAVGPVGRGVSREQAIAYANDIMEMHRYLVNEIETRRKNPTDDLISGLVHARLEDAEDKELSLRELLSCCVALLAAGNETTTTAIGWAVKILADSPELWELLREDDEREMALKRFTEEVLRYQAPVPQLPRVAKVDVEIGGTKIPAGSAVYLCYASANRDRSKFDQPDEFNIHRKNAAHHLTFGGGIHKCVGMMLARMEIKCAARALVHNIDDLKFKIPESKLELKANLVQRTLVSLPATFRRRQA